MSPSQRRPTRPTNAARIMSRARFRWCFLVSLKTSEIAKIAAIAEGTQWRRLKTIGTCGTLSLVKLAATHPAASSGVRRRPVKPIDSK